MALVEPPTSPADTAVTSNTSNTNNNHPPPKSTRSLPAFRYSSNKSKYHENSYADYACDDSEDYVEVQGMNLLQHRETAQELHKQRHLMTFNAVQLLKKQKVWLEDVSGTSRTIIELENLERKINWFMENRQQKKDKDPLTPSKALFRSMSMLDTSMEKILASHRAEMNRSKSEINEFKKIISGLQSRNGALLEATAGLQRERDELKNELELQVAKTAEATAAAAAAAATAAAVTTTQEESVDRTSAAEVVSDDDEKVADVDHSVDSPSNDDTVIQPSPSSSSSPDELSKSVNQKLFGDDLGSRWHILEDSEEATAQVAGLEEQICQLSALVAEKNGAIENLKGEWQHMRLQLSKLEENRLEYKKECETKESALAVAASRIASLEDEVLQTHAKCATSEEDYEALKESFVTQKEATKQEMVNFQEECGRRIDEIRTECERLLEASNESVNDMKGTVTTLEIEREDLRKLCEQHDERMNRISEMLKANLKPEKAAISIDRSLVEEIFPEMHGYGFSGGGDLSCHKEGEEKDEEMAKSMGHDQDRFSVGQKLAERASSQATKIAELQDANEIKDAQLKALHEMVESLLQERGEHSQWGHRLQRWKENRK